MSVQIDAKQQDIETPPGVAVHWPVLLIAVAIMLVLSIWPTLVTHRDGTAHHPMAMWLCASMVAGFVRGVGFVPRLAVARWFMSSWACIAYLGLALLVR